ncbi:zinc ribbon domain-containing protein [Pseudodesulfovibrio sp. JC047]|uniref:FmdB family zinc ribbon protein n=1 Tax=Pseudodesulfovibrio sp. JC047 TaxID=2683199 RepID=UPI0013D705CB|nr:zinc ribbon domain-containing protein [Pseudodesulfovibrio sp. JC047]NDV18854.1 zinc ribbon domain-containing protein [Pseudodesulfovibrio sp. JC047]
MPIYEYTCQDCGTNFEELVFSQDAAVPCPNCGSEKTEKQLSVCAIQTDGPSLNLDAVQDSGCGSGGG